MTDKRPEPGFFVMGYNEWGEVIGMTSRPFPTHMAAQQYGDSCGHAWKAFVVGTPHVTNKLLEGLQSLKRGCSDPVMADQIDMLIAEAV